MKNFLAAGLGLVFAVGSMTTAIAQSTAQSGNTLTQGMVQMTLEVGKTSQGEVLETFGAPNITTVDGQGNEMWVYDRHATVTSNKSGGFSIGLGLGAGGDGVAGLGGLGFGKKKSSSETSQRTMTLIIKFDRAKIVSDFRSRSSSF